MSLLLQIVFLFFKEKKVEINRYDCDEEISWDWIKSYKLELKIWRLKYVGGHNKKT